jgi:hypothetical protein
MAQAREIGSDPALCRTVIAKRPYANRYTPINGAPLVGRGYAGSYIPIHGRHKVPGPGPAAGAAAAILVR